MLSFLNAAAQYRNEIILTAAFVTVVVATRVAIRLVLGKQAGGASGGFEGFIDSSESKSESSSSGENTSSSEASMAAENEAQKTANEKQIAQKENLTPLFEMQESKTPAKARIDAEKETVKTTELLGKTKTPPREIQAQLDYLIGEINSLATKGLSDTQMAQNLLARAQNAPLDELAPLIDAMLLFVHTQGEAGKNASVVVGMDERFEQKAALSALARGNPEQAVAFLQNCAEKTLQEIKLTRNEHEKDEKFSLAGDYFRAAAAVQRPFDLEKSWQSLCRSNEYDSENVITKMMIGRACYEDGQTKKARGIFEKLALLDVQKPDFVQDYAEKMIPRITAERTMLHAHRIKENYQNKDAEAGQHLKTAQQRRALIGLYEDEHDNIRI